MNIDKNTRCEICGGDLEYLEDKRYYVCQSCGNQYAEDGTMLGNKFRGACDHRMDSDHEGMKAGECEPCGIQCPTPTKVVEHGQLCTYADTLLSGPTSRSGPESTKEVPAYAKVQSNEGNDNWNDELTADEEDFISEPEDHK